jgi:hypothetical protein
MEQYSIPQNRNLNREYLNDPILKNAILRQPKSENPLQLNEFRFILHRIPNTVYLCQAVNLPGLTVGETQQPSPFSVKIRRPGTSLTTENLTLSFLVNETMSNWMEIRNWIKILTGEKTFSQNAWENEKYSDATLVMMNSSSNPFIKVTFNRCFPLELGGINFATTVTDIAPAVASVSFASTGYDIEYLQ